MPSPNHSQHKQCPTSTGQDHPKPFVTVHIYSTEQPSIFKKTCNPKPKLMPLVSEPHSSDSAKLSIDEQLIVSQCKVLLVPEDAESLTHDSPLSSWIAAWERAGILASVMTAVLGDIDLAKLIIESHQLRPEEIELSAWPIWGLRVIGDEQRQYLNAQALHKTSVGGLRICDTSMRRCKRFGIEASMIDWLRVWKGTSTRNPFMAAVAGVGHCYQPTAISQCEMQAMPLPVSYRISVLAPRFRRSLNPSYVLSGYLRTDQSGSFYGYHPLTREQIPSVDVFSWLASNRLAVTQQIFGSHPFSLIERSMGADLSKADGCHVMGLHIRKEPYTGNEAMPVAYDVVSVIELRGDASAGGVISSASLPTRKRMPGVFPDTWIIDSSVSNSSDQSRTNRHSLHLCRAANSFESIINNWLIQVASGCGLPMHRSHDSFRTAKCSDAGALGTKYLLYPATEYAVRIGSEHSSRAYSKFRLPIGSLIGAGLALSGVNHGEEHPINSRLAIEQLIEMVGGCMRHPQPDLNCLLRWLIFDSLVGAISQIAYRYQIVSLDTCLALSPIPFWSTDNDSSFCERTRKDFGYQALVCRNEARRMLDGDSLGKLASHAGLPAVAIKRFRAECFDSLVRSAPTVKARLENEAKMHGALHSQSFRSAKSMLEWISEPEQPHGVDL